MTSEAEEDYGARDRLSELLYHLKEIVEQEAILRATTNRPLAR